MVELTLKRREEALVGEMLPALDTVATVLRERGIRLAPISTIRLIKMVYWKVLEEIEKEG